MLSRSPIGKLIWSLCLFFIATTPALSQDISVQLDGRNLQFDQPPAMVGGRLLVPLRGIFEALKADVVYDAPTRSIQATKGSRVVQLQLGSRTAIIAGKTLFLDVPADTIGGRTMVPLRFVSEALGADVKWEGATKTVRLSSTDGGTPTPPPSNGNGDNQAGAPRIDQVFHNATRPLQAGQSIDVIVYGESGGQASFEILGATRTIPLPEVSSGKYQTRWTIPNGLSVNDGVLLAHLTKNGKETATEASRPVTVTGTGQPTQPTNWSLSPSNGETVASARPQVALTFPQPIQNNSVRFFVDGVDFSNQVRLNGNQMNWQANYDLNSGNHQAEVQATAINGQRLTQQWNFNIDPNAGGGQFQIQELRPAQGATAGPRDQIGVIMNQNVNSINLFVDNRQIVNLPGIQRGTNGILWNPNYDLNAGQHRGRVTAVAQNGQVVNHDWTWTIGATSINNFNVNPNQASAGQQVQVTLEGPAGSTGYFNVGQVTNLTLRETSSGVYQGTYNVRTNDQGTVNVQAFLRQQNGQTLSSPVQQLTFSQQNQLNITNIRDGMAISPVFNVQGNAAPGRTVSVLVEYSSGNILGAITGQLRTIRNQTVVGSNGFFDVPIDGSAIRQGQQFRLTVSDGQSQQVMTLTRN